MKSDITKYLYKEFSVIRSVIFNLLSEKKWLYKKVNMPTKLEVLKTAKMCGLKIPNTNILSNKRKLDNFFVEHNRELLTKSLGEAYSHSS